MLDEEFQAAVDELQKLDRAGFDAKALSKKLSKGRRDLLYEIIKGTLQIDPYTKIDVQLFALKALRGQRYTLKPGCGHPATDAPHTEYDPAKNGENVLKHGLSFAEVTLTETFGTVVVPAPDKDDGERLVIFSTLDVGRNAKYLTLPLPHNTNVIYTLTIAKQVGFKFRLISSRRVSPDDLRSDLKRAIRTHHLSEDEMTGFVDHCTARIEQLLAPWVQRGNST